MRLHLMLVPPSFAQEDLAALVGSVRGVDELEAVPAPLLHLPFANFGNVALAESAELADALAEAAATWPPLELRCTGGSALEPPGDDSVWAGLDGDVAGLDRVGRERPRVVQRLGFLVDRRLYRPRVRVGRITTATTTDYLQRLLDRLDGYAGPRWTLHHLALMRAREAAREITYEPVRLLPVTGGAPNEQTG